VLVWRERSQDACGMGERMRAGAGGGYMGRRGNLYGEGTWAG
jgi:hypothetical protein